MPEKKKVPAPAKRQVSKPAAASVQKSVSKKAAGKAVSETSASKPSASSAERPKKTRSRKTASAQTPSGSAVLKKKKSAAKSTNGTETVLTAATSLSAAAKRIEERERLRKKRMSDRISERVAARAAANGNGNRPALPAAKKGKPLTPRDLQKFRNLLLEFRDRIVGDISFLTDDSLHRPGRDTGADLSGASQHSADHGTDNFDREFALSLATTEQDVLYEVDEALQRIEEGTYGICEMTGVYIEKARLEVIPYTRYSVQAQAKMEQGRARYRPFAQTFRGW